MPCTPKPGGGSEAHVAAKMAEELNATETIFPGTKLHNVFKLVSG